MPSAPDGLDDCTPELIAAIYDAAVDAGRWSVAMEKLAALLRGNAADLHISAGGGPALIATAFGIAEAAVESFRAHYHALDPVLPVVVANGNTKGPVTAWQVTDGRMDRLAFYAEWARPNGFEDYAAVALLPRGATHQATVGVARPRSVPHFDAADLDRIAGVVPHLRRAVEIHRRLAHVATLPCGPLAEALDRITTAVLLLDSAGRVIWSNRAADALLRAADCIRLDRHRTPIAAWPGAAPMLQRLVAAAVAGRAGSAALPRRTGDPTLAGFVIPVSARIVAERLDALPVAPSPRALLLLADPLAPARVAGDEALALCRRLGALYGLTRTEAAVAVATARGSGLPEVAQSLGLALTTARTHAQRAFHKAGVRGQAELARLVAGIASVEPEV